MFLRGRTVLTCPRKDFRKLKWNLNARWYWTLHFITDLMLAFSDAPVFLCLQQEDVTLSLRPVIVHFNTEWFQVAIVFWEIRLLTKPGYVFKTQNWNSSCPLPGLRSYTCLSFWNVRYFWASVSGQLWRLSWLGVQQPETCSRWYTKGL